MTDRADNAAASLHDSSVAIVDDVETGALKGKWQSYDAYKPSGVEWLGDVPTYWDMWKLSHAFNRIGSGTTPSSDSLDYYDGDIPWVNTSELRENVIGDTAKKLTRKAMADFSALTLYPSGSLLVAMYGATIGRLGILGIPATVNQACCVFADPRALDTKFTFYWLLMRRQELIALSAGGGQPNLNKDKLCEIRIPAPSLDEQRAIAAFLDWETAKVDRLIGGFPDAITGTGKLAQMVCLLKEYRTALISAAVTGKIDVRGEV